MKVTPAQYRSPVLLIIMDGIGVNPSKTNNAVALADTPNLDQLLSSNPTALIEASGLPVGLPAGQMGNSEVGHLTIGCGSKLRQDLVKINDAIEDGSFATNPALVSAIDRAVDKKGRVHLLGLVSDGGVHSHTAHLSELIRMCGSREVEPVLHVITDGRDTAPKSSATFVSALESDLAAANGCIATLCGRYYALDRDNRWDRVEKAWQLLINGQGEQARTAEQAIELAWERGLTDEFIEPFVLPGYVKPDKSDEWIFFNFRNDRPRELSVALADSAFSEFARDDSLPVSLTTRW